MADILSALSTLFTPQCLLFCFLGCSIGLILGAIPGLSGGMALTIMLPLSFGMDSNVAIAMLISVWIGSCSGGFIGSVLLGIPGTASSMATCYDGFAMTKNGEVTRALSIGTVANFMGTVPSILIAMVACPIISAFALKMGPWEYFALSLMAITLVISLSKGNMLKGFIGAGLGLLATQVGNSPISSTPRFTFGSYNLTGGFNMIAVIVGLFAGAMIMMDYAKGSTGASGTFSGKIGKFQFPGKDFLHNIVNTIRSFLIGLGIGFLPGLGAALSNIVAYAMAKNGSKHPEQFGKGCPDGIIAPEVANNASIGGAIIPMVSLGIPGDGTTALLLGGLIIHGIEAGPLLQKTHPVFVNMIFLAAVLGAIFALVVEIVGIRYFPLLLKAPYHYLYPAILVVSVIAAYINANNMFSMYVLLGFALLGIWMNYAGIPATPFVLSYVLGTNLESYFRKAVSYSRGNFATFFTRPASCVLLIITIIAVVYPIVKDQLAKRKAKKNAA